MTTLLVLILVIGGALLFFACGSPKKETKKMTKTMPQKNSTAKEILGNPGYLAISYGGYRKNSRDFQPTVAEIKEDMLLLHAMGIRLLRTYNVQLAHASNVLKAISEIQKTDPTFEMYVMLGAWIDCKNAWTGLPVDHHVESEHNAAEIDRAVALAQEYPQIVKIIAVGNEAMVKWAEAYYVQPGVILKWVNHVQDLKKSGKLPTSLWVTSSDNFASWGGGGTEYHVPDLTELIKAVDFISLHTYPMHDTHYNPVFWGIDPSESQLPKTEQIDLAMERALGYAQQQFKSVQSYMESLGISKPLHIGETGWATSCNDFYGSNGAKATDEYKEALFYKKMRDWTAKEGISCFYFEAFDEPWKDAGNPGGSENYFGLFTVDGKAKFALWDLVDKGVFKNLGRNGQTVEKTFDGNLESLMDSIEVPTTKKVL